MDALSEIALKFGTDKCPASYGGTGHSYTPYYFSEYNEHRTRVKRVFELGINDGASVYTWEEFFPNADIYCADIHRPGVDLVNRGRIKSHYVDQTNAASLMELRDWLPRGIDLMIDDGNHWPEDQVLTANILADRLSPGGMYVIEDIPFGKEEYVVDRILWPWKYTIITFDLKRKSDDCLIVLERE